MSPFSMIPTKMIFAVVFSSVVSGLPSPGVQEDTWDCPESCNDETSHPGCHNASSICERLEKMLEKQKNMENLVITLKQDSENSAHSLLVMGTALFVLVPIILLGLALVLLKLYLPSFFKCLKKQSHPERRPSSSLSIGRKPTSTQNLRQLSVSTIRLANHQQSSESPLPVHRISRTLPHSTFVTEENKQQTAAPRKLVRQPSESTCPDESSDTQHGCDNLGHSTSTLHNQSTSSSNRSLGGNDNSTRTLNTMLPSDNSPNQSLSTRI